MRTEADLAPMLRGLNMITSGRFDDAEGEVQDILRDAANQYRIEQAVALITVMAVKEAQKVAA